MKETFYELVREGAKIKLKINMEKTRIMRLGNKKNALNIRRGTTREV